mmetsp:Transcript_43268/g.60076  ORF Transcript_43268/g.60076 Transcript_43268/m.60076 type:complete len:216 (-) Transcript_43268:211-858(-)
MSRLCAQDLVEPFLANEVTLLRFGYVGQDCQVLGASGKDHLANLSRAAFALFLTRIGFGIHSLNALLQQLHIALRFIHRSAEELQATHICSTFNLNTSLATFLQHLLQLLCRILRWLCFLLWCLLLLLLQCLLDIFLVHLHLLQGIGLSFHHGNTFDALQLAQKFFLRGKLGLFPFTKAASAQFGDHLEVQTTTTDDALDTADTVDRAQVRQDVI